MCLKSIIHSIMFYVAIGIPILIVAYLVYIKSVETRKFFKCTNCGETFRTEHMTAKSCKVCGAALKLIDCDDEDVSDKTH